MAGEQGDVLHASRISTSSMKVCIGGLQLKGSALLWRKMLLPQLNMVVEAVLGERFEEWFWEK
jgi:hypothetical protein